MAEQSALENEATADTTTFEHFDREWTIPTRRHMSHMRRLRDELRRGFVGVDLTIVETFLDEDQLADLAEIDPDERALAEFSGEISKRLGFGSSGN